VPDFKQPLPRAKPDRAQLWNVLHQTRPEGTGDNPDSTFALAAEGTGRHQSDRTIAVCKVQPLRSGMARSVSGVPSTVKGTPEDPFSPLRQKLILQDPP